MTNEEALSKAKLIAGNAFKNKTDKAGSPYITHCLTVMEGVKQFGTKVMIAALLHDLLEDCPEWNAKRLASEGFSQYIIDLIQTLTKPEDADYEEYIGRIAQKPETTAIKCCDLRHNMDLTRLPAITDNDIGRIKKYHKAYKYLKNKT